MNTASMNTASTWAGEIVVTLKDNHPNTAYRRGGQVFDRAPQTLRLADLTGANLAAIVGDATLKVEICKADEIDGPSECADKLHRMLQELRVAVGVMDRSLLSPLQSGGKDGPNDGTRKVESIHTVEHAKADVERAHAAWLAPIPIVDGGAA